MARGRNQQIVARWDGERLTYGAPIDLQALRRMEPCLFLLKPYRGSTEKQLRFLNVVVAEAVENAPEPTSREKILHTIKRRFGWFTDDTFVNTETGEVTVEVRSTADMDREELKLFIDQVLTFITEEVCPGMDVGLLRKEAEAQSAERRRP
jgi:hypothetical protein